MSTRDIKGRDHSDQAYVKENPATYLVSDATFTLECARVASDSKDDERMTRFARTTILLYAIALEAFINFVYKYSEVPTRRWRKLSLKDKWLRAVEECLPLQGEVVTEDGVIYRPGDPVDTFREEKEPFASFLELKAFRDSVVHLKPTFANVRRHEINSHLNREEYYPASGLPKRLQFCRVEHAETALGVYRAMTEELDRQMKGLILRLFVGDADGGGLVEEWTSEGPAV
jgi:hypothetical protein